MMRAALSPSRSLVIAVLTILGLASCRPTAVAPCGLDRTFQPICEIENPEDLVRLEGTPWILLSQAWGGAIKAPLAVIHSGTLRLQAPQITLADYVAGNPKGEPSCDGPPARPRFRGIDVRQLGDGRYIAAGISGTEVQRVELFDVVADRERVALTWVGCVNVPRAYFLNDVAIGQDGVLYATHMFSRPSGLRWLVLQFHFLVGDHTGYAVAWRPDGGWSRIANSNGSFPNGITTDRTGALIYMASTYSSSLSRIEVATGKRLDAFLPVRPDNVSWTERGSLIITGGMGIRLISSAGCLDLAKPGCAFPFGVVEADAELKSRKLIFSHADGKIPGASSALLAGNSIFLGSAAADRVTVVSP